MNSKPVSTDALDTAAFRNSSRRRLLSEAVGRNAINFPGKIALHDIESGWKLSFGELEARAEGIAASLAVNGLAKGERICVLGRNYVDTLALYLAVARLGAIVVPLNHNSNSSELRYIIEDCAPSMAVIATEFFDDVDKTLFEDIPTYTLAPDGQSGDVAGWASRGGETGFEATDIDDRAASFLLYTGGTTGNPKGVLLNQAGYVAMAESTIQALAPQGVSRSDSWLILGPLFHGAALAYSIIGLCYGQTVHLLREYHADKALDALTKGYGSITWFIPTMSRRTIDRVASKGIPVEALDALRLIISAGAPLSLQLRKELKATFRKCEVIDIVGQTEMTSTLIVHAEPQKIEKHPSAVGLPAPGVTVTLLDDGAQPVGPEMVGEICYRSESIMLGYWNKPEVTAESMVGGWFHSGDLGRRSEDGLLFIVGRKKELIKTGGENVIPNEVEDVLRSLAGVADACVLGLPDEMWGERIHGILAVGDKEIDVEELTSLAQSLCREKLSRFKVPKTWSVLSSFPANGVGKVDKKALLTVVGDGKQAVDLRSIVGLQRVAS